MPETPQDSLLGKIAAYTEILSIDPRSTIFVSLSETYRKMGMLDDAFSVAEKGLDSLPDYSPGHVVLARIKCQQGDLTGSETAFNKALEYDPNSLAALVGFSRLYLLQKRKKDARALLLKARDLSPADSVINKLLLGLPEEALEPPVDLSAPVLKIETPVMPVPEKPPAPLESATLADLYHKQGMADKALDIYRNLLARDPDNLDLRRRIRKLETGSSDDLDQAVVDDISTISDNVVLSQDPVNVSDAKVLTSQEQADTSASLPEKLPVLEQLNRLLNSIQKRRRDV